MQCAIKIKFLDKKTIPGVVTNMIKVINMY